MNLLIILSIPYIAHTPYFFILDRVSKPLVAAIGGDSPPKITHHLVNSLVTITN